MVAKNRSITGRARVECPGGKVVSLELHSESGTGPHEICGQKVVAGQGAPVICADAGRFPKKPSPNSMQS